MSALFHITNGTDTVNLLARGSGFHVRDWQPAITPYKDGGITLSNVLSDSKAIALRTWDFAEEAVTLSAEFSSPDLSAQELRKLRRLIRQAENFWDINHRENQPVWVAARAQGETNTRYAVVFMGTLVQESNPFSQPFMQHDKRAVHGELILGFQRTHWSDTKPGSTLTALLVSGDNPKLVSSNGSFEDGVDGWEHTGDTVGSVSQSSTYAEVGTYSLRWQFTETGPIEESWVLSPEYTLDTGADRRIFVSMAARHDNPIIDMIARWYDSDGSLVSEDAGGGVTFGTSAFVYDGVIFDVPDSAVSVRVGLIADSQTPYTTHNVYIDDFSVRIQPSLTSSSTAYVGNVATEGHITDIYRGVFGVSVESKNLLWDNTSFPIFANDTAGDFIAFRSDMPFSTLVFNIENYTATSPTLAFEVYNSSTGFTTISAVNTQGSFSGSGPQVFSWKHEEADWEYTSAASVGLSPSGYWFRLRITDDTGMDTITQVADETIYVINSNFLNITASDLPIGGIDTALKMSASIATVETAGVSDSLIVASRKVSRGVEFFNPHIYLSDTSGHNKSNITITSPAANTSFADDSISPVGRNILFSPPVGYFNPVQAAVATFSAASSPEYVGRYRVFVVTRQAATSNYEWYKMYLTASWDNAYFTTDTVTLRDSGVAGRTLYDLGYLTLFNSEDMLASEVSAISQSFTLTVWFGSTALYTSTGPSISFEEIILMPADEMYVEARNAGSDSLDGNGWFDSVVIDSIGDPRKPTRAYDESGGTIDKFHTMLTPDTLALEPDEAHQLFFLWRYVAELGVPWQIAANIAMYQQRRYYSMRGNE